MQPVLREFMYSSVARLDSCLCVFVAGIRIRATLARVIPSARAGPEENREDQYERGSGRSYSGSPISRTSEIYSSLFSNVLTVQSLIKLRPNRPPEIPVPNREIRTVVEKSRRRSSDSTGIDGRATMAARCANWLFEN